MPQPRRVRLAKFARVSAPVVIRDSLFVYLCPNHRGQTVTVRLVSFPMLQVSCLFLTLAAFPAQGIRTYLWSAQRSRR